MAIWRECRNLKGFNPKSFYWVTGGEFGERVEMCRFNDYQSLGWGANKWQTLGGDDFMMTGTLYIEIKKPGLPVMGGNNE